MRRSRVSSLHSPPINTINTFPRPKAASEVPFYHGTQKEINFRRIFNDGVALLWSLAPRKKQLFFRGAPASDAGFLQRAVAQGPGGGRRREKKSDGGGGGMTRDYERR